MTRIKRTCPTCDACVILNLLVCGVVLVSRSVAGLQNYLDNLSSIVPQTQTDHRHVGNYLKSLDQGKTISHSSETTFEEPPDDHYAKDHFGAGWAGYKHPLYGGYLDQLTEYSEEETITTETTEEDPLGVGILPVGKKAEYGDDIRWGAQVYLDNL